MRECWSPAFTTQDRSDKRCLLRDHITCFIPLSFDKHMCNSQICILRVQEDNGNIATYLRGKTCNRGNLTITPVWGVWPVERAVRMMNLDSQGNLIQIAESSRGMADKYNSQKKGQLSARGFVTMWNFRGAARYGWIPNIQLQRRELQRLLTNVDLGRILVYKLYNIGTIEFAFIPSWHPYNIVAKDHAKKLYPHRGWLWVLQAKGRNRACADSVCLVYACVWRSDGVSLGRIDSFATHGT